MGAFGPFSPAFWDAVSKYGALAVIAIVVILGALWFAYKTITMLLHDKMVQSEKASLNLDTMTKNFLATLERIVNDYKVAMLDNTKAVQSLSDGIGRSQEQHAMHQKNISEQYGAIEKSLDHHADLCASAFSNQGSTLTSMDRRLEDLQKK